MTSKEAIKVLQHCGSEIYCQHYIKTRNCYGCNRREALDMAIEALNEVQKHEETFEWCHDCKEYDTENYCCHRWSKVIRNTVEELKEEPPTIPCFTGSAEAYKAWTGEDMGKTSDLISRADAIEMAVDVETPQGTYERAIYVDDLMALPSADAVSREDADMLVGLRNFKEYIRGYNSATADVEQGRSNHEVACMLAELFGDDCACNYNGIDEWLPLVCDLKDSCQNTVGVACWEQFLKHYERREP